MSMKQKLMLTLVLLASVPMLVSVVAGTWFARDIAGSLLIEQAEDKLTSVREFKKRAVEDFFANIRGQIATFSENSTVVEAAVRFGEAYGGFNFEAGALDLAKLRTGLERFYRDEFGRKYQRVNPGSTMQASALMANLSDNTIALQAHYISENTYPLGEKDKLLRAKDLSLYSTLHAIYHPQLQHFLETFGYYDIFIVHPETGNVVYSVFKELDFATSLIDGPYANTGIGEAFRAANAATDKNFVYLSDFGYYTPSYEDPASFIASPIFDHSGKVGILIFQIPSVTLNAIMTNDNEWQRVGLGESGETYLVGADKTMRSTSRFLVETPQAYLQSMREAGLDERKRATIEAKNISSLLQPANTVGVQKALNGETGFEIFPDYRGIPVLSAYTKLDIPDLDWVILSEMDEREAFAPAQYLSQTLLISSVSVAGLMLGVAVLLGWWFTVRLTSPIQRLEHEIGEIEAHSDLSRRLHSNKGDVTNGIVASLNNMLGKLNGIVSMVAQSSVSMADASSHMSDISTVTSKDVLKQKQETDRVAEAMQKMTGTVADVAANADDANSAAKEANTQANQGNNVVISATQSITELAGEVQRASDVIARLANETDNIGGVLDVIRGIAEQTNLLALNAAIEAARAGEQGRGFAVVADEVRTLASRTQESTEEIQKMIEGLQTGARDAVSVMEHGQQQVQVSVAQANEASEALQKITRAMAEITRMNEQIAAASGEQRVVTDDVTRSIDSISTISDSTTSNAQQTEQASVELNRLSSDLKLAVEQFRL